MSRIDWVCTAASRPDCWPPIADRRLISRGPERPLPARGRSGRARPASLLRPARGRDAAHAESRRPPRRKRRIVRGGGRRRRRRGGHRARELDGPGLVPPGRPPPSRSRCRRVRPALRTPPAPRRGSPGDRGTPDRLRHQLRRGRNPATGAWAPPSPRSRTNRRPASPSSAHRRNSSKDPWTQPSRPWRSCAGTPPDLTARFPDERPAPTRSVRVSCVLQVTATWACEGRRVRVHIVRIDVQLTVTKTRYSHTRNPGRRKPQ